MTLLHKPAFGPYQYHRLNGHSPFCAHCGQPRRTPPRARFCDAACKQAAYRRRLNGLPEDHRPNHARSLERYGSAAGRRTYR